MKIGKQTSSVISISIAVLLAGVMIFFRLGHLPIHLWDESRLATNAFEMYRTGFSWVTTFHYRPDTWNTKPPLLIWLQCCSFHFLGVSETSLRLPTAIAGLLTCFIIAWFCSRKLNNNWLAIISVVVLCTCDGFTKTDHSVFTGDYDAMLTLFMTCAMLSFYLYVDEGKKKYLVSAFAALALATLTKGVAALVFTPAVFLYFVYRKKLLAFLKEPVLYGSFIGFCIVVAGYYLVREHYDAGYFNWVRMNELGGRFLEKGMNASHPDETWFYLKLFVNRNFGYWWMLLVAGMVAIYLSGQEVFKRFSGFVYFSGILFMVIISCSKSKSEWYDMQVYPLFAIATGMSAISIFNLLTKMRKLDKPVFRLALFVVMAVFFVIKPYREKLESVYYAGAGDSAVENTRMSSYLQQKLRCNDFTQLIILRNNDYQANIDWYQEVINSNAGYIAMRTVVAEGFPANGLQTGDTIAVYQNGEKRLVNSVYSTQKLADRGGLVFYRLNGLK